MNRNRLHLLLIAVLAVSISLLAGCRREDIREMTVELPGLVAANQPAVIESLSRYGGIDRNSFKWDLNRQTLTLSYDSMQVAQSNIRYAIEAKGIKVKFPVKTDERAGH